MELVVAITLLITAVFALHGLIMLQSKQVGVLEQAQQDLSVADLPNAKAVFTDAAGYLPVYDLELLRVDCCPTCSVQCLDPQSATATLRQWVR